MNTSEKSFNQAWEKLTTEGEMCSEKVSQDFTPIGIRKNVQEEGPLYHGTKADLKIGDYLKTGYPWLSGLKEKKAALLEALEQAKEPTIPELLSRYLDKRSEERTGWTSKGKLKGTVGDFNKVMEGRDDTGVP